MCVKPFSLLCDIKMLNKLLLICVVCVSGNNALKLPVYIKGCSRSDKDLNICALNSANNGLSSIVKGDKQYRVQVLDPLHIDKVDLNVGENLKMIFSNVSIQGMKDVHITYMNIDLEKKHWKMISKMPFLNMLITYDIKGRILILPIVGSGPGNFTLEEPIITYNFDYELIEQKGNQHIKIKNPILTFVVKRMHVTLENLFNGDKRLGDEMNRFLNESWDEVLKEIGPGLEDTFQAVVTSVISAYFNKIPYDQMFLP